jgi:hypothetical protein
MRAKAWALLLGLGLLLLALAGCDDDGIITRTLGGTLTGLPAGQSTVTLLQNGQTVRTAQVSDVNPSFSLPGLTQGTYAVAVQPEGSSVRTLYGPVSLVGDQPNVDFQVFTQATLPAGVVVPNNGTATLAAFGLDQQGDRIAATVTVDALPQQSGNPAVVTDIPVPGPHDVTVTTDGNTVTIPNVPFTANTVTVVLATTNTATVSVSGSVDDLLAVGDTTLTLLRNGVVQQTLTVTGANPNFTFNNVAAGTYIIAVEQAGNPVQTYFGPLTVDAAANLQGITIDTFTAANLPAALAVPANGTATAAAYPVSSQGVVQANDITLDVGDLAPQTGNPAIVPAINPGTYLVTATRNAADISLGNITFDANTVVIFDVVVPVVVD